MLFSTIFTILGATFLGLYISKKIEGASVTAMLIKTWISFCFMAVGICGIYVAQDKFGIFVLFGLLWGLLGDIWLDLKYVYLQHTHIYTFAGFACFAVGHIFYNVGLFKCYFSSSDNLLYFVIPAVLAIAAGFSVVLFGKIMKLNYGRYKIISMVYGALLFMTMFFSCSLAIMNHFGNLTLNMFAAGSILFAASDLVLSGTYFGEGHDKAIDIILNYVTYYPAQFLIAFSILFSGGSV